MIITNEEAETLLRLPENTGFWAELDDQLPTDLVYLRHKGVVVGVELSPNNNAEIHIGSLKGSRGKSMIIAAKQMISWIFRNVQPGKILCRILLARKDAILFSRWVGMKEFHRDQKAVYCEISRGQHYG